MVENQAVMELPDAKDRPAPDVAGLSDRNATSDGGYP
jgi:hypothetical protein